MPVNPKVAIIIGTVPDDPVKEIVKELAKVNNFFLLDDGIDTPENAMDCLRSLPDLGADRAFMLLCSESIGDDAIAESTAELHALRGNAGQIIIYALSVEWGGQLALDCIEAGARDYLVRGSYDPDQLRDRIRSAMEGVAPAHAEYRSATVDIAPYSINIPKHVFVITPFGPPLARDDYHDGIVVALERLNIPHLRADEERRSTFLHSKIRGQIDNSILVIANISKYGRSANPNVYFEIGYAIGQDKPYILVRRKNERGVLPSDIQGIEYLEYLNSADLALKLFFGLKPHFEP